MTLLLRLMSSVLLLAAVGFCAFGFLATFEPLPAESQVTWRLAYGLVGGSLLAGLVWLWRPRRRVPAA